ncbi:MAG: pseudouridine synthase [Candidatus Saccharibacteria bacterium]|nr:pseudouridine synthase [Candidatus Saccharibacteria bacterium]
MRINQYIALATGLSRRKADELVASGKVAVNNRPAETGQTIQDTDSVTVNNQAVGLPSLTTIMLNKPPGYVTSRDGQGSPTIYDLLPTQLHHLKPIGRLDKDSSGLLLLTNDGQLAQQLTHPRHQKTKRYQVALDKPLANKDQPAMEQGVSLEDGLSRLKLKGQGTVWTVTMSEGRNRQIRRTFAALGYRVTALHRTHFGSYFLGDLKSAAYVSV